jgi:glyoxylase-like metal-dependent hydrolase (beta-lactamase superfamily II)
MGRFVSQVREFPVSDADSSAFEATGAAQVSAWRERVLPPVEQLGADLWSVPVPMPTPLRYTSVYVLAGESGLTLIDAGWGSDESWTALRDGLTGIGASITDVRGVLVTHQHFDHIGLARRVREASGAWIALHPADRDVIVRPEVRDPALAFRAEVRWLVSLGAGAEEATRLSRDTERFEGRAAVAIPDRLIEDGEDAGVPGWSLRAVHTPGHTPGHLCFVEEKSHLVFVGDHVLARISPHIAADRREETDALGDYLSSLGKMGKHPSNEVLPAHEWRFRGLRERTEQLSEHYERRLAELLEVVRRQPGSVPWQLAAELTWSRSWDQYDGRTRITAVSETTAHLLHLRRRGLVVRTDSTVPAYTAVGRQQAEGLPCT